MENIFDRILKIFENPDFFVLNSDNNIEKKHIFFNILNDCTENLEENERIDMIFFFNCIEKSIQASRSGAFTVAEHWIKKGQDMQEFVLNPFAQNGMKALYHPTVAYYNYVQKDFKEAIYHQKVSICYWDKLIVTGFKEAISAKMEQSLNLIKAYQADNKKRESEALFQSLFSYVLIGNKTLEYSYDWCIVEERFDDRIASMKHYYDSIFFNEIANNYDSIFKENSTVDLLNTILRHLLKANNTEFKEFSAALESISLYLRGEASDFLKSVIENNLLSNRVPNAIRLIISEYCIRVFHEFGHHEINHFEKIFKNFVKVHLKIAN